MPELTRDGATIHYEVHGDGPSVLALAPGGLRSRTAAWERSPYNPVAALPGYQVITMDQRNAGRSRGPIGEGWSTYTADQVAVLDHLGVDDCRLVGMCIGGPFIMGLVRALGDRVRAAVMLQPIGLDGNRHAFEALVADWREEVGPAHAEVDDAAWDAFGGAMFGGEFMFNATRDEVASCVTPLLLLYGDDVYHPRSISEAIAELAPRVETIERWKDRADTPAAAAAIEVFLDAHSAVGAT